MYWIFLGYALTCSFFQHYQRSTGEEEIEGEALTEDENEAAEGDNLSSDKDPASLSKSQELHRLFQELYDLFPQFFISEPTTAPWFESFYDCEGQVGSGSYNVFRPKLKVSPDLTGSWLDPREKGHAEDSVGYWPHGVTLPPTTVKFTPPGYNISVPPRIKDCPT